MAIAHDLTVVLIAHDQARQLPLVLAAIAANTARPAEVILADDASTDGTADVFQQTCRELSLPGQALRHPPAPSQRPFRVNSMRNAGLRAARTPCVVLLDGDHVPGPLHLATHLRLLARGEHVVSTGPRLECANADGTGPVSFMWGHEPYGAQQASPEVPLPSWALVPASNMGLHRAFAERVGMFDPDYDGWYGIDDQDFTCRAHRAGAFFAGEFGAYVVHLPHETALGRRDGSRNMALFRAKHGHDLTYPPFVPHVTHPENWACRYARFRQGQGPETTAAPVGPLPGEQPGDAPAPWQGPPPAPGEPATSAVRWAATNVGGRFLIRLAIEKLARRLRGRNGRP